MSVLKFRNPNYTEGGTEEKWITLQTGGGIEEAPVDGNQYVRQDGAWAQVEIPESGIEEAPMDDKIYGRQNGTWIETGTVFETVSVTLLSNQSLSEDLIGAVVTLTNHTTEKAEEQVWNGQELVFKVAMDCEYSVSYANVGIHFAPSPSATYTAIASNNRTISAIYVYNPSYDLSMHDIYGNDIARTTANCYVIKEAGKYMFPLVYGNALKNGEENSAAYTNNGGSNSHDFVAHDGTVITTPYIENLVGEASEAQLSIADTDGVFTNISVLYGHPFRYVLFEVASVPATGANAIISVKDSSGVIMWNWHIWVWSEDMTSIEVTNSTSVTYKLLPYNLGSKWDDDAKTYIKNWHYQFGRPTPMICPSAYNSATDHATYGTLSFATASIASNIQKGIQNPATFYKNSSSSTNFNWFSTNSDKTYNLWDADCTTDGASDNNVVKTVYDPSPVGFKMPNGNTFTGFSIISNANGIVKLTRYSGDATGIGIPASGYRSYANGLLFDGGSYGYVWYSAAYSQSNACSLAFSSSNVYPQNNYYRTYGFSVRPVEE